MRIRQQLPAYSPVTAAAAVLSAAHALHLAEDARPRLVELLKKEYDADSVLLCGSGTQALTIAIRQTRRRMNESAPVAIPAFSCFDVATAVIGADVHVSFYDVDPATLGPDFSSLERVMEAGANPVVIAPLYGIPVDWTPVHALAKRHGSTLIEDAAQGHGALWQGRPIGSLGDISILSFGRGKGWTGGYGGAVLMRRGFDRIADDIPRQGFLAEAKTAAAVCAQFSLARPSLYGIPRSLPRLGLGDTVYRPPKVEMGITRVAAQTLTATHQSSRRELSARQKHANMLQEALSDLKNIFVRPPESTTPGALRLPLRLKSGLLSYRSASEAGRYGIAPSYPSTLADLPQIAPLTKREPETLIGARTIVRELVTLPTHSLLREQDLAKIIELTRDAAVRAR